MTKINLGERNGLVLSIQAEQYKEFIANEIELHKKTHSEINPNEVAKREMAAELMLQGFSNEAICRILNLDPDQLPETIQS